MLTREAMAWRARRNAPAALLIWLLAALLVLGALPARAEPPGDDEPQLAEESLEVEITDMTPAVLRPGDDWTIEGTITNTGAEELSEPVVRLRLQNYVPASRSALAAWNISGSSYSPRVLRADRLDEDLAPGKSKKFSFDIPADESPFTDYSQWGPRGIAVTATSDQVRDAQRTSVLWYPHGDPIETTTELTVIAPLTPTSQEWATAVDDAIPVAQAAAARLAPVVQQTRSSRIAWALDPALLDDGPLGEAASSSQPGPDDESSGETTASATQQPGPNRTSPPPEDDPAETAQDGPEGARPGPQDETTAPSGEDLTDSITQGVAGRDVVALGYGKADPAALRLDDDAVLADAAADRAADLFDENDIQPIEDMLWPARHDRQSLSTLADRGIRSVVLPEDAQDPATPLTYSPSNRSRIDTDDGELEAALWDTSLSAIFDSKRTPLQIRQSLLAETAVIAREHPAEGRGFLAALPSDIGSDADQLTAILDALAAVDDAPWLEMTNMRSLLGRSSPDIEREALPQKPTSQPVLNSTQVFDLSDAWSSLAALAAVAPPGDEAFNSVESTILSALSTTLAGAPQTRGALVTASTETVESLSSAIQIEAGSTVNLISANGEIPIAVQSSLHTPVTVTVRLVPEDPRLQPEEVAAVTVEPQSATTARIPVTALSNGNVDVHAEVLTAPDGEVLAAGEAFSVRVRADWESTGTIIVAAVLVVGFVIGLARTIRRGQRSRARRRAAAATSSPATAESPSSTSSTEEET